MNPTSCRGECATVSGSGMGVGEDECLRGWAGLGVDLDEELLKDWEDNLQGASITMMKILSRHANKKVKKLQAKIDNIEKEFEASDLKEVVEKNYENVEKVIEGHQVYLHGKQTQENQEKLDGL
ncbi:hypothetical protein NDU88_002836 [Pleurodeles waltl]|uniref:Uncharacterized protein n=1 Tax=Pleurodeles waltl TaxID=8319 RepID=A0AAV7M3N6_PLEWA|nr:hypothetical protein NDU88_002836 [Pleurodeles waltl]